jgi:hypothetical protein
LGQNQPLRREEKQSPVRLGHHPEEGEQLLLSEGQRWGLIEAQFLLLPPGLHWYDASVLFRLLVVANLILLLLAVVAVLVSLLFSLPWGMLHSGFEATARRPN